MDTITQIDTMLPIDTMPQMGTMDRMAIVIMEIIRTIIENIDNDRYKIGILKIF
jgi:hypothetical protein